MSQTTNSSRDTWRKAKSGVMAGISFLSALLVMAPLGLVLFYLLKAGATSVDLGFFLHLPKPVGELGGGMANAI
ncbi:MAG: phosphate ABC transporter permease PtsA, partial [Lentisphaerae bacterium]|nr:phosphate ABC transporter permease PtsA [Lentisphaerota bacterium]